MAGHNPHYYWQRMLAEFKGAKGCNVSYSQGVIALRYHDTVVASFDCANSVLTLDSGGWMPPNHSGYYTKERINRFCRVLDCGVGVAQAKRKWTVVNGPKGQVCDWRDGMTVQLEEVLA